jgi:hypothetical protein
MVASPGMAMADGPRFFDDHAVCDGPFEVPVPSFPPATTSSTFMDAAV